MHIAQVAPYVAQRNKIIQTHERVGIRADQLPKARF